MKQFFFLTNDNNLLFLQVRYHEFSQCYCTISKYSIYLFKERLQFQTDHVHQHHFSECVCVFALLDSLGQLLLGVGAELQQPHEHRRHVHVRLPYSKASANQIDGGAADGAVGGQLGAGGLQQQEGQCFTFKK